MAAVGTKGHSRTWRLSPSSARSNETVAEGASMDLGRDKILVFYGEGQGIRLRGYLSGRLISRARTRVLTFYIDRMTGCSGA